MGDNLGRKSARSKKPVDYAKYNRYLSDSSDEDDEFIPARKKEKLSDVKHKAKEKGQAADKAAPENNKWKVVKSQKKNVITISDDEDDTPAGGNVKDVPSVPEQSIQSSDTSSHWYSPLPVCSQQKAIPDAELGRALSPLANQTTVKSVSAPEKKLQDAPLSPCHSEEKQNKNSKQKKTPKKEKPVSKQNSGEQISFKPPAKTGIQSASSQTRVKVPAVPKWTPPGPAGTQKSESSCPGLGLRIGLSRKNIASKPLHSVKLNATN